MRRMKRKIKPCKSDTLDNSGKAGYEPHRNVLVTMCVKELVEKFYL